MNSPTDLNDLSPEQLRTLAAELIAQVGEKDRELRYRQTHIDQLTSRDLDTQALEIR